MHLGSFYFRVCVKRQNSSVGLKDDRFSTSDNTHTWVGRKANGRPMAAFRPNGVGVDNFIGHGLPTGNGVLSFMLLAAAKP